MFQAENRNIPFSVGFASNNLAAALANGKTFLLGFEATSNLQILFKTRTFHGWVAAARRTAGWPSRVGLGRTGPKRVCLPRKHSVSLVCQGIEDNCPKRFLGIHMLIHRGTKPVVDNRSIRSLSLRLGAVSVLRF